MINKNTSSRAAIYTKVRPKLEDGTRKLQVHLDNVKGPKPPPPPPPPWNIAPVPRAQLRIYHSRLLTDPARNSSWPSRLHSTSRRGQGVFTVARFMSVLPPWIGEGKRRRGGEGDAGKSFPDKCAVLVLTASGEDREGISFSCQPARPAISPLLVRLSLFSNESSV